MEYRDPSQMSLDELRAITQNRAFRYLPPEYRQRVFEALESNPQIRRAPAFRPEVEEQRRLAAEEERIIRQGAPAAVGIVPPTVPPPAPPYTGPATPETPAATPPSPPRPPLPPREPARPGAPAVGLPPRVEMGEGNISELVSQRLGQIKPPEETKSFLDNPYLALVQAGLSMMADSRGKSPLEAIAGGGRAGLQTAMDQRAAARAQEQRRYVQEMERLKAENEMRRTLGEEEYRRASLGATQRGQDIQARSQDMQSNIQERVAERQERIEQFREGQARAQALRDQVRDILKLAEMEQDRATQAQRNGDAEAARVHSSRAQGYMREVERLREFSAPSPEASVPTTNQGVPTR